MEIKAAAGSQSFVKKKPARKINGFIV